VRIDLRRGTADVLISDVELAARRRTLQDAGGFPIPPAQTPWQDIQRRLLGQLSSGAILEESERFQQLAQTAGLPRDNH
jgi:dihydroxy-acid dehydratase